ncbi:MAG: peptidyl-tRNA hydrolase Pth2 [Nanoarchaeota archaeon]
MNELKQVILIRKDLKLSKGKSAAQASHASVESVLKSDKNMISKWRMQGMKKIVLSVNDEKELFKYLQEAKDFNLITSLIKDAGRTEVKPGTPTCIAIGPDNEDKINVITEKLKNY